MSGATHPVGVVGIGLVGLALVERLRAARIKIVGYDIDPARCEALRGTSSIVAPSAGDVFAACDNVVLALPDGGRTAEVVREALPQIRAGSLLVDCGTSDPDQTVALAVRLAARGVRLVDAPLSGSSQQVREGTAVMMIGGDRDSCDALEPVLAAIASRRFLLGPPGSGARAKLATNLLLGLNRAALAEALVFAQALSLDLPTFLDLVRATPAYSRAVDARARRCSTASSRRRNRGFASIARTSGSWSRPHSAPARRCRSRPGMRKSSMPPSPTARATSTTRPSSTRFGTGGHGLLTEFRKEWAVETIRLGVNHEWRMHENARPRGACAPPAGAANASLMPRRLP